MVADLTNRAPAGLYRAEGMIKNVNTIEEYRNVDKSKMILQAGKTVWARYPDIFYKAKSMRLVLIIIRSGTLLMTGPYILVLPCSRHSSFYRLPT